MKTQITSSINLIRCAAQQQQGAGRPTGSPGQQRRRKNFTRSPEPVTEQVTFARPLRAHPHVAVIGGGLSGLCCALELARLGLRATVFDTGEHGVGGRLATRRADDGSLRDWAAGPMAESVAFDHAAQFFTAVDPEFAALVARWEQEGAVKKWTGPVGVLEAGSFTEDFGGSPRYVGIGGMRALAQRIEAAARNTGLVEVKRPQWVGTCRYAPSRGTDAAGEAWRLISRGEDQGAFDCCVIAHNGKCANRLAAPMGSPQVYSQLTKLRLAANWVVMAAFSQPLGLPFEGAFVRGSDTLTWAANNTAKLGLAASGRGDLECWTLISTAGYGKANKVPQEAVPAEVSRRVAAEMLDALGEAVGAVLPAPVLVRTQQWGAALPLNTPDVPCIWDARARVGVCGDWVAGGGSVQAAALSGAAMARRIHAMRGAGPEEVESLGLGLERPFKQLNDEEIGQFPGQKAPPRRAQAPRRDGGRPRGDGERQRAPAKVGAL